jgi:iron(III) transport system substrate-binding protein
MKCLFRKLITLSLPALLLGGVPFASQAQQEKTGNKDIYLYQGSDRYEKLVRNAKAEGTLSLYSVLNLKDSGPLLNAFEKKYGIKVQMWRGAGEKVVQRAVSEAQANRHTVDVVQLGTGIEILYREKLLEEFHSPHFKNIPAAALPKHRHYAADSLYFYVVAYNTNLLKPEQVPTTYEDFLRPKWSGGFSMDTGDIDWFGALLKTFGEAKGQDYFKKLAAMKPQMRNGHTLLAELVSAGETPITIDAFNYSVENLKKKGAPINWKPLQPTIARAQSIGLSKNAPHPHAALLFVDFILSNEGQQIVKAGGNVPISTSVDSPLKNFDYQLMNPADVVDEWDNWNKQWTTLFLGGKDAGKEK